MTGLPGEGPPAGPDLPAPLATRYEPVGVLGQGGFGRVLRCRDRQLGRDVAVKVLLVRTPRAELRFQREAELTARLEHPGVVRVYDHGRSGSACWIVYEFVDGPSLAARRGAAIPTAQLVRWGRGLAEALAAIHREGVLHRDLKPENVLLRDGRDPVLVDFGLGLDPDRTRLTETGAVVGTAAYLAPEIWWGEPFGPASDQWALGATLFELHCGTRVQDVSGPAPEGGLARLGEPPVLPRERPVVAPGFEAVLLRALAPEPAARYPDLAAFEAALATLEGGATATRVRERGAATDGGPAGRPGVGRGWVLAGGLAVVALSVVGLGPGRLPGLPPVAGETAPGEGALGPDPLLVRLEAEHDRIERRQPGARVIEHAQRVFAWLMDPRLPLRLGRVLEELERRLAAAAGGAAFDRTAWAALPHLLDDVWQLQRLLDSPWNLSAPLAEVPVAAEVGAVKDQYQAIAAAVGGLVGRWRPRAGELPDAALALVSTLAALLRLDDGRALFEEIERRRRTGGGLDPALEAAAWDLVRMGRDYEEVATCAQRFRLADHYEAALATPVGPGGHDVRLARLFEIAAGALVLCPAVEPERNLARTLRAVAAMEADPTWRDRADGRVAAAAAGNLARRIGQALEVWGAAGLALKTRLEALAAAIPGEAHGTR